MKVWFIAVLLAVAATVAVAGVVNDVTKVPETDSDLNILIDEDSETKGKDAEKNDEDSNESSSEENEDEGKIKAAVRTCPGVTTYKPVAVTKQTFRPYTQPRTQVKPAYVKPAYTATTNYNKPTYEQVAAPVYKPVITTEAPKPTVVYNVNYAKPALTTPAPIEVPKYVKPTVTVIEVTTPKYVPISYEKPVITPAVTIRKSGWVRAPGYKLGFARGESSNQAVVEVLPQYTQSVKTIEAVTVATAAKSDEKSSGPRQTYPKWFFKTKSTGN